LDTHYGGSLDFILKRTSADTLFLLLVDHVGVVKGLERSFPNAPAAVVGRFQFTSSSFRLILVWKTLIHLLHHPHPSLRALQLQDPGILEF